MMWETSVRVRPSEYERVALCLNNSILPKK